MFRINKRRSTKLVSSVSTNNNNSPMLTRARKRVNSPTDPLMSAPYSSSPADDGTNVCLFESSIGDLNSRHEKPSQLDYRGGGGERLNKKENLLYWISDEAPNDLLPKILSFLGSQKIAVLSRLNKKWNGICLDESVWRTMCEDTGKWEEGRDLPPVDQTWLEYYCDHPLIPVDYASIESAFRVSFEARNLQSAMSSSISVGDDHVEFKQHRCKKFLLRPDKYIIHNSLIIDALGGTNIVVETLETKMTCRSSVSDSRMDGVHLRKEESVNKKSKKSKFLGMLGCRSTSSVVRRSNSGDRDVSIADSLDMAPLSLDHYSNDTTNKLQGRAEIILKTRKPNEPTFRVKQGVFTLKKVDVSHDCTGNDIWNGNAAVQVQPPLTSSSLPIDIESPNVSPKAFLDNCRIISSSGRGVVAIDGGEVNVSKCLIHHCAATGLYVGGPGSIANIHSCDVIENGNGNESVRRGIARGHSGIYLEQGRANITNSNVSYNALTGISAVSTMNAYLYLEQSDLIENRSIQLEIPDRGTVSHSRSTIKSDNLYRNAPVADIDDDNNNDDDDEDNRRSMNNSMVRRDVGRGYRSGLLATNNKTSTVDCSSVRPSLFSRNSNQQSQVVS